MRVGVYVCVCAAIREDVKHLNVKLQEMLVCQGIDGRADGWTTQA